MLRATLATAVIGALAAILQINKGPEFLVGAHSNTATKVTVDASIWLLSVTQTAFAIAFFITGLQAVRRLERHQDLTRPLLLACGFSAAVGLIALASLQHLAVDVVQDQNSFDLGPRGTRAAVLLISRVRSYATWSVGAILIVWILLLGRSSLNQSWPRRDQIGLGLVGLVGIACVMAAGGLEWLL